MRLPRVVALGGMAGAGKDTVADYLVREHGYEKVSFAAPIRKFIASLMGLTLEEMEKVKEDPSSIGGRSPRYMMQTLGTEWGRGMVADSIWEEALLKRLKGPGRFVVSDTRFPTELEALSPIAETWYVSRGVAYGGIRESTHSSEGAITEEDFRVLVDNSGTYDELYAVVDNLLADYKAGGE